MKLVNRHIQNILRKNIYNSSKNLEHLAYGIRLDGQFNIVWGGGLAPRMSLHQKTRDAVREPLYTILRELKTTIDSRLANRYYLERALNLLNNLE